MLNPCGSAYLPSYHSIGVLMTSRVQSGGIKMFSRINVDEYFLRGCASGNRKLSLLISNVSSCDSVLAAGASIAFDRSASILARQNERINRIDFRLGINFMLGLVSLFIRKKNFTVNS